MAQTHNVEVIKKGAEKFIERLKKNIFSVLSSVADDVVIFIQGGGSIPVYTGNLQDSTGIGIYFDGVLTKFKPIKIANVAQNDNGKTIVGTTELDKALEMAVTRFNKGIWIVLFSAVPYAFKVEERTNFFSQDVAKDLLEQFLKYEKLLR